MKKIHLALIFTLATMTFSSAQEIEMQKVFGGYTFTQNGERLTMGDLVNTLEPHSEAFDLIKKARTRSTLASIIGFAGGGLIGWPVGTALGGGDAEWTLAGIGAGLIAVGIPISLSANKKTKQAVELYNSDLNSISSYQLKPELKIITNGNGIGLSVNF